MDCVQGGSGGFGFTEYDGPPVFVGDDPFLLTLLSEGGSTRTMAIPYTLPKFYIVDAVDGIPFARDVGRRSTGGKKDGKFPSFAFCFDLLHIVSFRSTLFCSVLFCSFFLKVPLLLGAFSLFSSFSISYSA